MDNNQKIYSTVKERYKKAASGNGCCTPKEGSGVCCENINESVSEKLGYSSEDFKSIPKGSNLGLGCGNPILTASIKEGETVLDLGSGAGIDCFIAAKKVGPAGKVIGVDMTKEMIIKAKENSTKGNYENVEFKLGYIEKLPIGDNSIDLIISNCVVNLSPDKQQVYNEAFRVLRHGGRISISDIILIKELPEKLKQDLELYTGCISGASTKLEIKKMLESAGFKDINIQTVSESSESIKDWLPENNISKYITSATISAKKI